MNIYEKRNKFLSNTLKNIIDKQESKLPPINMNTKNSTKEDITEEYVSPLGTPRTSTTADETDNETNESINIIEPKQNIQDLLTAQINYTQNLLEQLKKTPTYKFSQSNLPEISESGKKQEVVTNDISNLINTANNILLQLQSFDNKLPLTPGITPGIIPGVTPDITPGVTPGVTPDITPGVTSDFTSGFTPTSTMPQPGSFYNEDSNYRASAALSEGFSNISNRASNAAKAFTNIASNTLSNVLSRKKEKRSREEIENEIKEQYKQLYQNTPPNYLKIEEHPSMYIANQENIRSDILLETKDPIEIDTKLTIENNKINNLNEKIKDEEPLKTTTLKIGFDDNTNEPIIEIVPNKNKQQSIPSNEMPPPGEMPPGEMPLGEMPSGEMPLGEMPSGEMPSGEMPSGEMPSGEMPQGEMPMV